MTDLLNPGRRGVIAGGAASLLLPHAASALAAKPESALAAKSATGGFVWGVAAAAAQTESRQGRGRSNWDVFADTPGKIADGSTNARCTEFDRRYPEDLDLLKAAGVPAFRFSIAWPRIQPDGPGTVNQAGIDLYARIIDAMLERGIDPWVTLFHWDTPVWAGDFRDRDIAARMADYADIVVGKLGDRVGRWIVLNEPNTVATLGYATGRHAPGLASPMALAAAVHHQNLALGLMTKAARARARAGSLIGTTHNVAPVRPESDTDADRRAAATLDAVWNGVFLAPLFGKPYPAPFDGLIAPLVKDGDLATIAAAKPDFLGLNYYSRLYARADKSPVGVVLGKPPANLTMSGQWPVEPDGLTEALAMVGERYGAIPIYITETGFALEGERDFDAERKDDRRAAYLDRYLAAAATARAKGVDLRGVFYWSATDNWEWAEGFTRKFGLVAVDPATQRRGAKASLARYGSMIARRFPDAIAAKPVGANHVGAARRTKR